MTRHTRCTRAAGVLLLVVAAVFLVASSAWADGIIIDPRRPPSWIFDGVHNTTLVKSSTPLVLQNTTAGVTTHHDVGYTLGSTGNPYVNLQFKANGDITYRYSLPMNVNYQVPSEVVSGKSYTIHPYLTLDDVALPTFSATQKLDFLTSFNTGFHTSVLGKDVGFDASLDLPNVSYAWGSLTAHGQTDSLDTAGQNILAQDSLGHFTVRTDAPDPSAGDGVTAWEAKIDLIALLAHEGVGQPGTGIADGLGFDLGFDLGMPIYRLDTLYLSDYSFDPITFAPQSGLTVGASWSQDFTTTLHYQLWLQSKYFYGGSVGLYFDGPLMSRKDLFDWNSPYFWVANREMYTGTIDVEVPIHVQSTVGEGCRFDVRSGLYFCWQPFDVNPLTPGTPPVGSETAPGGIVSYTYEPVPEPATIVLTGIGLGAAALARRRRR